MSMFWCALCGDLKDSDDGGEAADNGTDMVCVDCIDDTFMDDELEDEE